MTKTRTWKTWDSMLQRCENPRAPDYHRYGGRGIKVCQQWHDFERFLSDMGERPEGRTIERLEIDGPYEPDNCCWATATEQQRNKTNAVRMTLNCVTKNVHDWAEELGMSVDVIKWRLLKGWQPDAIVSKPVRPKRPNGSGRKPPS